jgi:hypothetical protein
MRKTSVVVTKFRMKKEYETPANICGRVRAANTGSRSSDIAPTSRYLADC